jgi:nitrate/nitrite transporter NarK
LFLLEGLPALVLGIAAFFYLDDSVAEAKWLSNEEKAVLQSRLDADAKKKVRIPLTKLFTDARVWLFSAIYFFMVMGMYGIGFWLPNIIKAAGVNDMFQNGLLSAIPYLVAAIAMVLVGRNSDRTGERHWHLIICSLLGAAGFWLSSAYEHNIHVALLGTTIAASGLLSAISLSWSLPTAYLTGTAAAAGIATINSIGNLSGFVSPLIIGWIKDATGSLAGGLYFLSASLALSAILVFCSKTLQPQDK